MINYRFTGPDINLVIKRQIPPRQLVLALRHSANFHHLQKGDHVYRANPKITNKCDCFHEPKNQRSPHAVIVKKHNKTGEITGHVTDTPAKVL